MTEAASGQQRIRRKAVSLAEASGMGDVECHSLPLSDGTGSCAVASITMFPSNIQEPK